MPRSSQYVALLKKLIEATEQDDREVFDRQIEEIKSLMGELDAEEHFDLEINIRSETKRYFDRLS